MPSVFLLLFGGNYSIAYSYTKLLYQNLSFDITLHVATCMKTVTNLPILSTVIHNTYLVIPARSVGAAKTAGVP